MVTRRGEQPAEQQSPDFSLFDSQCPTLNLRTKHIWQNHCTVIYAFIAALFNAHFSFVIVSMKRIWDVVFENYSASGTCIVFSQVIATVIQRAEPTEVWDHNQQWFDLHHRSILGCCFSSLGAVQTERGRKRRRKKKHPSLSFSWSNRNRLLPLSSEVKSNCRQNQ